MYEVYLGELLLPVAPSKIEFRYGNKNETATLLDGSEINIIKKPGLTEYSFDMLLPYGKYPFAAHENNAYASPLQYISRLKAIKDAGKPFLFKVIRGKGAVQHYENVRVTLESYSYAEDAEEGMDIKVSVKLKEYRDYSPVSLTGGAGALMESAERASTRETPSEESPVTYTVKSGDTLWDICRKHYGDGEKFRDVAAANGISVPSLIYAGQVIVLE